jgi:AraC-like DNA-binding protein
MSFRVTHSPSLQSSVLHERGWRRYAAQSPAGALSIKCMFGGTANYETRLGRYRVDDGCYLLLNHGTPYTIVIDSPQPLESFCIFFAPGFVEQALHARMAAEDHLLADPADHTGKPAGFFERTYPHDHATLAAFLSRLRKESLRGQRSTEWWDEQLHRLAVRLLDAHRAAQREAARLPAARASTRAELYRRLHRARDYMEASLDERLRLHEVAGVAAMAPHHFLRAFKQAFGATPHQYLTSRRMARAQHLLAMSEMPVTEIGLEVGFSSLGSFSWLFRRRTGASPEQFRRAHRRGAK